MDKSEKVMRLKSKYIHLSKTERLYHLDLPLIGLTGGIATGKSTVTKILKAKGISVIDADELVKSIYQKPQTIKFISDNFPEVMVDGKIDFTSLREKFFHEEEIKNKIESYIYQELPQAFNEKAILPANQDFYLYDVPLLFEKKLEAKFDLTVVVYAPAHIQRARLLDRDGNREEVANAILRSQMDIETKRLKADLIIENNSTLEELKINVHQFLHEILA